MYFDTTLRQLLILSLQKMDTIGRGVFYLRMTNQATFNVPLNMLTTLITVGDSKAIILPSDMIKRFHLANQVSIEGTPDGILIRSAEKIKFESKIEALRKDKAALYKRMEAQANDPETQLYYSKAENNYSDRDLDIFEG